LTIVGADTITGAIRNIVADRLENLGLQKLRLPLGVSENEPNLPIFISTDLKTKKRVVVLFYEHTQDIGIFAHRIIGGKGGINAGSAVDFVKYVQAQTTAPDNADSPGVILANMGQLRWWRCGKRAVTQTSWYSLPQKSAVEKPYRFDMKKNVIPDNGTPQEHVAYVFNYVIDGLVDPSAKLSIIGVSDGATQVSTFLEDAECFKKWGPRISAFAALATCYQADEIQNCDFRNWLLNVSCHHCLAFCLQTNKSQRGRAYVVSPEPAGSFIAGPQGGKHIPAYGCPVFSLSEPYYSEAMLPKGYRILVDWFQEVAADSNYANPTFERIDVGDESDEDHEFAWNTGDGTWDGVKGAGETGFVEPEEES